MLFYWKKFYLKCILLKHFLLKHFLLKIHSTKKNSTNFPVTHLGPALHAEKPWWFDLWMLKVGVNENFWGQNTKVCRSLASVIWFCTFCPKWPQPIQVQPLMLKNLDDLTSEGVNENFSGQRQKWVDLWPPSFDFGIFAQNGLNPSGASPSCRKTLMIWPLNAESRCHWEFLRSKAKVGRSWASVIWFWNFCPK